jgi:protein-L-isoaspartate(D-aspartate) O-methyltransferase
MGPAYRTGLVRLAWWLGLTAGAACVSPPDPPAGTLLTPPDADDAYRQRRARMVAEQIEARGVRDPRVLAAVRKVPRHLFVPLSLRDDAYDDSPLPIGLGQTISQPYIVAYMTELLQLEPAHRVLEIGTGSGYQAAVLAELVSEVYSVELLPELAERARTTLQAAGYTKVHLRTGDGYLGWPEHAPFDRIVVTAAPAEVPGALVDQLSEGGRLVIPVGTASQYIRVITRRGGRVSDETTIPVRFVPLVRPGKD